MLKLRQLQKQKQEQLAESATAPERQKQQHQQQLSNSASQLRLRKDLASLDLPPSVEIDAAALQTSSTLYIRITPDEGYYESGRFSFKVVFKDTYPIEPPKVTLMSRIFHPNIDVQGNVCLNILREDWSPVLDVQSIVVGLLMLFLEPNATDPLNKAAANILKSGSSQFQGQVRNAMSGGLIDGQRYDRVVK
ncbi:LANO_0F05490g1_1 [Lachancea nothofagi CBS 11611]|uniref:NEDD8-conjugating enzyme UBC12 n=1 Tax=Lachancea nothofagi CBS 11611 TaxID=1266666 RepID=A0A1G4K820_9SACH|nr:LANO_0F05490g1_1 [Lachancea nothofagi CBS 11611]